MMDSMQAWEHGPWLRPHVKQIQQPPLLVSRKSMIHYPYQTISQKY